MSYYLINSLFIYSIRFLLSSFTSSLTLSSNYLSTFPHGTCSLSVSRSYLALCGAYHTLWTAIPGNPTLRHAHTREMPCNIRDLHPVSSLCYIQVNFIASTTRDSTVDTLHVNHSRVKMLIQRWAYSISLAVTLEIVITFFSFAY